jgi:hypothetical protein
MGLKLNELEPALRRRIQEQIAKEDRAPFRSVETSQPKPPTIPALASSPHQHKRRQGSVAVIVTLIACVGRELDSDNLQGSLKPLRDAIAAELGLDDGDKRIRWQYGQIESRGQPGVIVKIETPNPHDLGYETNISQSQSSDHH